MAENKKGISDFLTGAKTFISDVGVPLAGSVSELVNAFKKDKKNSVSPAQIPTDPLNGGISKGWLIGGAIGLGVLVLGVFALILSRGKSS